MSAADNDSTAKAAAAFILFPSCETHAPASIPGPGALYHQPSRLSKPEGSPAVASSALAEAASSSLETRPAFTLFPGFARRNSTTQTLVSPFQTFVATKAERLTRYSG